MQENTETTRDRQLDEELADVLIAISVIAKRLARKLQMANQEGGTPDGKMSDLDLQIKNCAPAGRPSSESPIRWRGCFLPKRQRMRRRRRSRKHSPLRRCATA